MATHWHTWTVLLVLLVLTCASAAQDQNPDRGQDNDKERDKEHQGSADVPTYRSAVSEVRVTFFTTDESNHPVQTLTTSDFAIVDNERVVRNFRSLTQSDETSLELVVLVDLSESVAPNSRVAVSDALQLITREQSIADDKIAVMTFGGTFGENSEATRDSIRPALLCASGCGDSVARLQGAKSGGLTPLFDALVFAADFISRHGAASSRSEVPGNGRPVLIRPVFIRPVFILFSDGMDTISLHSASEALQAVLATGALIYSADVGAPDTPTSGSLFLRKISSATGGRYFPPRFTLSENSGNENTANENAAFLLNTVLEDLRASYVVTYDVPGHQTGFHALRLLPTHNLNLTFHSRSGYDYEPADR
jgi:VWFA-related protein